MMTRASRSYRRRGERKAEFEQERRENADRREHELSQRLERNGPARPERPVTSTGRTGHLAFRRRE